MLTTVISRPATTGTVIRGMVRHLVARGEAPLVEVPLPDGRRADIMALAPDGTITLIEVKSCLDDFRVDRKWGAYLAYCDRFGFAVPESFPLACLPEEPGVMVADGYDAIELRPLLQLRLAPARRRMLHLRFARLAALRTLGLEELAPVAD